MFRTENFFLVTTSKKRRQIILTGQTGKGKIAWFIQQQTVPMRQVKKRHWSFCDGEKSFKQGKFSPWRDKLIFFMSEQTV